MKRLNTLIKIFLALLGTGFFALIIYVSILGENHKIDYQVTCFFDDLKNKNYDKICNTLPPSSPASVAETPLPCMESSFLMELAFLSRYDLLSRPDYTVVVRRSPFWFPFVSGDTVSVSVAFTEKKNNIIEKMFHDLDDETFIDNFITVSRRKGSWVIEKVNLESSSIFPLYQELEARVNLNRYITDTGQGFRLNETTIDPATLSPLNRRLLEFSLNKIKQQDVTPKP